MPTASELFANATSPIDLANKFESYKATLSKALSVRAPSPFDRSESAQLNKLLNSPTLSKSLDPRTIDTVRQSLAQVQITKDLTVAGPGSTGGLQAFDLQAPAVELSPRSTPIRNKMPRQRGVGTSHRYKRITGWSGSGTGGTTDIWPGISETTTNTVAGLNWRRGPVITLEGDQNSVPYMTFSMSNSVTYEAEFTGMGYQDIRQLATTSLLWSSMVLEEKMIIEARGTTSPYSGGLGAPSTPTVTCTAAGSGQTAVTGITSKAWAAVTACTRWGETPISSTGNGTFTSGNVVTVSWAPVTGAYEYRVYLGSGSSDPTSTGYWLQLPNGGTFTTSATTITFQGAVTTSGTAASTVTVSDTTASATGYDGMLAYLLGPDSGYVNRVNSTLSTNAGNEIQIVTASIFDAVKGNPQEVFCNGFDRKQLSDQLKNSSSSSYRITLDNGTEVHDARVGSLVTGIQNEVTGSMMDVTVGDWWPQGTMGVISWSLPIPDSQISSVWSMFGPVDYMGIEWPSTQLSWDSSSLWINCLVCFAPEHNGAVTGIVKA